MTTAYDHMDLDSILSGDGGIGITQSSRPPSRPEHGDLIPIVNLGVQTPSLESAEPISHGNPTARHPALRVAGADGKMRTFFSLHPTQIYGSGYVEEHALAFAAFMRNQVISFVRTVAGMRGLSASDLLQTGFEDLTSLMRETLPRSSDMFLPNASHDTTNIFQTVPQGGGGGGPFEEGEETEEEVNRAMPGTMLIGAKEIEKGRLPSTGRDAAGLLADINLNTQHSAEAVSELVELAKLLRGFGKSDDILRVYRYLQNRSERYDYTLVKWLTLPMNLSQVYFKDNLKAAVENSLSEVLRIRNVEDNGTLFAELLNSSQSNTFAQLVARHLDRFQWNRTAGDKRITESVQIQKDIDRFAFRLRDTTTVRAQPRFTPNASNTLLDNEFNPV